MRRVADTIVHTPVLALSFKQPIATGLNPDIDPDIRLIR